jgi:hypothetical protein
MKIVESTSGVLLNDRIASLTLMSEIWRLRPKIAERALVNAPEQITNILKRSARDVKRTLVIVSIDLLFRLLTSFAKEKNQFAPNLYKTLTFLLVEFYWEVDMRQLMLKYFTKLFEEHESIPINILVEPLLRQIELS